VTDRLEGKVAIVTGAWRGNGEGIARVLAKHGACVVLTDVVDEVEATAEGIRKAGQKAIALKMDVTETGEVNQTFQKVFEKFGRIDILVNNAGIYPAKNLVDTSDEFLHKIFDINVFSMYRCARAVLPIMMKQKYGKIVNLSIDRSGVQRAIDKNMS
jgi:NAD(P)-dependent dehydrogenase (short-subunit alcohol dehydrogenase family)